MEVVKTLSLLFLENSLMVAQLWDFHKFYLLKDNILNIPAGLITDKTIISSYNAVMQPDESLIHTYIEVDRLYRNITGRQGASSLSSHNKYGIGSYLVLVSPKPLLLV